MKVRFGSFVFDSGARELLKHDAVGEPFGPRNPEARPPRAPQPSSRSVHLSPKAFDVLEILLARRPNVVTKDILLNEVWPGKVVEEANLAIVVGEIRKALADDSKSPAIIVTVARRGYRFAAEAEDLEGSGGNANQFCRWWLSWNDKTFPLREGENIVGRHPSSAVWIDGTSVSRTHARILASPEKVLVEDRGSRNGTFVEGKKISSPHALVDGNAVTFGSEITVFRQWSDEGAVGTEPVKRR
jgi:hypothetical protein